MNLIDKLIMQLACIDGTYLKSTYFILTTTVAVILAAYAAWRMECITTKSNKAHWLLWIDT